MSVMNFHTVYVMNVIKTSLTGVEDSWCPGMAPLAGLVEDSQLIKGFLNVPEVLGFSSPFLTEVSVTLL